MDSFENLWYDMLSGQQEDNQSAAWEDVHMAGRRNRYGYQEYRGRDGKHSSVLIFIIVLLAVLLIAGVIFMAVMSDYITYTRDGMEIHWPWMNQEPTAPPVFSDPVVMDTDDIVITEEPAPGSVHTPRSVLAAVTVTAEQLRSGTAAQAVADAGGSALLVEMKASTGKLAWQSQTELAASLYVNAADNDIADAIRKLARDGDLYLVARVHCFRDPFLTNAWIGPLMSSQGRVWYDLYGIGWSSPANQETADYLSALCRELADMGFDEILLDDAGYPCLGEMDALATDSNRPEDRTVPVAAFLQRLAGELEEKDVYLSVYAYEALTPEGKVYSGLTAAVLAQNAGRVWLDEGVDREYYERILSAAGLNNPSIRMVVPAGGAAGGSWYQ